MPRRLRIEIADGVYLVTNRGVDRTDIVRDDQDRQEWFRLLGMIAMRCEWRVFAYALMNNHFHLFVRTPHPNLSLGMHDLESAYVTFFNRRTQRPGPLMQGRFGAVMVESEGHLWELSRYVHLNPFRARLASHPAEYAWCSYRFYLDPREAPAWLDWRTVLADFAGTEGAARLNYRRFVETGILQAPPDPL